MNSSRIICIPFNFFKIANILQRTLNYYKVQFTGGLIFAKKNNTFSKHISLSLSFPLTNQLTKHLGLEENALSKS